MSTIMSREVRDARRMERRLRQIGDGAPGIGGELSAAWRALAPWAILVTSLGLAPAASALAEVADMRTFLAACLTLAGCVAAYVSLTLTKGRMTLGRWHELVNVLGVAALLVFNVGWGFDRYVFAGGLIFGATSAYVWNRRHTSTAMRELERTAGGRGAAYGNVPQAWQRFAAEHLPQVADARMTVFKDDPDVFVAGLDMGPAGVPEDLTGIVDRIGRFAGGIIGGTTLSVGDKLDKVGITVVRTDPLKTPTEWQGPTGMGESIAEPIGGLGRYRDGVDLALLLPHVAGKSIDQEDKQQSHMLMIGMSRAGKGEAGEMIDLNVALRKDAAVILCDSVKADQQLGVIGDAAAYVLPNASAIRAFLWKLVHVTIPQRAAFLGNPNRNLLGKPLKEWQSGCGLTWLLVHAYEAAAMYGNENLVKITERAASVGIQLIIEAQKGIHDRVDTNARSNAADLICFGTYDRDDTTLVVNAELLDLGVAPWVWKNKRPGSCYLLLSHLPLSRQLVPARFARKARDGSDIAAAWAEYRHLAGSLDPLTARTFGEPYEKFAAARAAAADRAPRTHTVAPRPPVVRGAVLLDERPAAAPAEPGREPAAPRALPETGFDLDDDGEGEEDPPTQEEERAENARVAEQLISEIAAELDGHPEARQVLATAVDALEEWGSEADQALTPEGERFDDIEFPDDPDEAHFRVIVDRSEAIDILLDVLGKIGEGNTFRPSDLYDELARRARKSDSWVRKCMPVLRGWGCIQEAEAYGVYEIIHTRRGDLTDYGESQDEGL